MSEFGELVLVRPGPTFDDEQNRVPGVGATVQLYGVVEPTGSTESVERGRSGAVTGFNVYVSEPPESPVSRHDEIQIRGDWYVITGSPSGWVDPEGDDLGGIVIVAQRAEG